MEVIDVFFKTLSQKFREETKLSDIIWIMCSSSEIFQNIFLEYCFEKNISVAGEIIREYYRNNSKPDFYFIDKNDSEYIIENKIYDHGDHFDQYINAFPNATRSFIANYIEPEHKGWFIKNWENFIKYLEEKINNNMKNEEFEFIQSFVFYLKSVTNYWEVKVMNFTNLTSLYNFSKIITEIIQQMGLKEYNIPSNFNEKWYGKSFFYENKDGKNVYIWLGLYIPEPSGVYISFNHFQDENCLPSTERKKIENLTSGEYYDETDNEYGDFFIHLKDEYYTKLCNENVDVSEQKDIIKNFLTENTKYIPIHQTINLPFQHLYHQ